ncbi:DNA-binding response regulator [Methylophaga marina]|uniref:Response regulator transcription factor n=1 Tax=Methylophaga marina TaxID=45495 RepID=A0ABP3D4K1_9GAMM|nr:response regulator transcription factor [Methylophaga marina]BDZ75326.1 DNA-binding response regulator [Methylophaga marina]
MKLLLVDDHQLFLDGLTALLSKADSIDIIETVNNGQEAFEKLMSGQYDVALIDLRLPIMDGFELLQSLSDSSCLVPIIIVSASSDPIDIDTAFNLGAMSFIPKSSSGETILNTIEKVMTGQKVFPDNAASDLKPGAEEWARQHNITKRQLEVLRLMRQGFSNQAIAEQLSVSMPTVKSHVSAIFQALGTQSRSESSKKAHQLGLD